MPKPDADTNEVNERGKTEDGVFVFTATTSSSNDPSSSDYVKSKRRAAIGSVTFNLSPEEIRRGGEGERSRDEMAILAQQLELGGSDNVSKNHCGETRCQHTCTRSHLKFVVKQTANKDVHILRSLLRKVI